MVFWIWALFMIYIPYINNKVNVQMLDYRDIKKRYDCIVSIEMIEAVGEKYLNHYFKTIKENLVAGGRGVIQAIVIKDELHDRYKTKEDFIQKYIFPHGRCPALSEVIPAIEKSGLLLADIDVWRKHYYYTLLEWHKNFMNKKEKSIVITSALRTAIGTFNGSLKSVQAHDLSLIHI